MGDKTPLFIGIDLAWSTNNRSGLAILRGGEVLEVTTVGDDKEILKIIDDWTRGEHTMMIAIDAPLIVPNESGSRPAEQALGRWFRSYHAGAHPANRRQLGSWTGVIRGEMLSEALAGRGFTQEFLQEPRQEGIQRVIEIYPHPAMISLFGLDKVLSYKPRAHRDYATRHAAFARYAAHLKGLREATPPLYVPDDLFPDDFSSLRGKALKACEDCMDALFSAYLAYYYWYEPKRCWIFGNLDEGYIITPRLPQVNQ